MMKKFHYSTVYGRCYWEVSAHKYVSKVVFNTTLPNMMEKQQRQITRNFSSTRNRYFTGQNQTPRKFNIPKGKRPEPQQTKQYHPLDISWIFTPAQYVPSCLLKSCGWQEGTILISYTSVIL